MLVAGGDRLAVAAPSDEPGDLDVRVAREQAGQLGGDEADELRALGERLGNTLIGDARLGKVIEVDPKGATVWKYESEDIAKMRMRNSRRTAAGTTLIGYGTMRGLTVKATEAVASTLIHVLNPVGFEFRDLYLSHSSLLTGSGVVPNPIHGLVLENTLTTIPPTGNTTIADLVYATGTGTDNTAATGMGIYLKGRSGAGGMRRCRGVGGRIEQPSVAVLCRETCFLVHACHVGRRDLQAEFLRDRHPGHIR